MQLSTSVEWVEIVDLRSDISGVLYCKILIIKFQKNNIEKINKELKRTSYGAAAHGTTKIYMFLDFFSLSNLTLLNLFEIETLIQVKCQQTCCVESVLSC